MKITVLMLGMLLSTPVMASNAESIYKCDYSMARPKDPVFVMSGDVIPSDAEIAGSSGAFLTLAPVELSGFSFEARILFTYWNDGNGGYWYNRITLHRPGKSASPVASTTMTLGQPAQLSYTDADGTIYSVHCDLR